MPRASHYFAILMAAIALFSVIASSARSADQALIESAKKEGQVTWYTTQQIDPLVRPVVAAFEKKYAIRVDYIRADSSDVALRILNEGRAGKAQSDIFDGTAAVATLKKQNMVVKWLPDAAASLPRNYSDPDGYWIATNLYVITAGYNTDLVKPGEEPRDWNDLLAPRWKGRMLMASSNSTSAGPGFIGLVLTEFGEEKGMDYLRRLARQDIAAANVSGRQILDQIVAGEFAIGLQIFNHASVLSARQGAPVKWIPMNPSLVNFNVVSLTAGAPHPNAAKLLEDFVVSKEGQELYHNAAMLTVHPDVAPFDPTLRPDGTKFRAIQWTPEEIDRNLPGWVRTYQEIFR